MHLTISKRGHETLNNQCVERWPVCMYCTGKEVKYVQNRPTLKPDWQTCFDAHLYPGRAFEIVVMQRPDKKVGDVTVKAQSLSDHCKTADDIATVWVTINQILQHFEYVL